MVDRTTRTNDGVFPHWVWIGGVILALGYLPMLAAPFDFMDDGNLVYPTRGLSLDRHAQVWWDKVAANVEHLGPFRPTVWLHWHCAANAFGAEPHLWRAGRLLWCGLAAVLLLAFLHSLNLDPAAALFAGAAAMWNPYRNEIWTSLTLAEGVAMPYAMLALLGARRAALSRRRATAWDAAALLCLLVCLGCKNVFIALLPAMLLLRLWQPGSTVPDALRANWWRVLVYLTPAVMPVAHFLYFKSHWKPGYYETPGPSLAQASQFLGWLKGAGGADFLAPGLGVALAVGCWKRCGWPARLPALVGLLLLLGGFLVYLPLNIMSGRYTMPAVWGADVLLAAFLTRMATVPLGRWSYPMRGLLACGLMALLVAGVNRQEKILARNLLLWEMLGHVERTTPTTATIAWISGPTELGELNAEEGIHFAWHLLHRGRGDVRIQLRDQLDRPLHRVELADVRTPAQYRLAAKPSDGDPDWARPLHLVRAYRFGTKQHNICLEARAVPPTGLGDALVSEVIRRSLIGSPGESARKLLGAEPVGVGSAAITPPVVRE